MLHIRNDFKNISLWHCLKCTATKCSLRVCPQLPLSSSSSSAISSPLQDKNLSQRYPPLYPAPTKAAMSLCKVIRRPWFLQHSVCRLPRCSFCCQFINSLTPVMTYSNPFLVLNRQNICNLYLSPLSLLWSGKFLYVTSFLGVHLKLIIDSGEPEKWRNND